MARRIGKNTKATMLCMECSSRLLLMRGSAYEYYAMHSNTRFLGLGQTEKVIVEF